MGILDDHLASVGKTRADITKSSRLGTLFRRNGVRDTPELQRILRLPRRRWEVGLGGDHGTPEELRKLLTQALKREGGTQELRPVQAAILADVHDFGGALGCARVGAGKCVCGNTWIFNGFQRIAVRDLVGQTFQVQTRMSDGSLGYSTAQCFESGVKECIRLAVESGLSVELSIDHPVLTKRGWIPVEDLADDFVAAVKDMGVVWRRVSGLYATGLKPVYDLSVPETGCFVGDGIVLHNTLVSFLAPKVLECERPLLLIPASLRDKTHKDWLRLQEHWVLPSIRIESYEMLSREKHADMLNTYKPDLIVSDECHLLANSGASCTRRVKRYMAEHPETVFVGLSGTITKRSLHNYQHMLKWALGELLMPLPSKWDELTEWAECIDVTRGNEKLRAAPGALTQLCNEEELKAIDYGMDATLEAVRKAYQRRFTETPGVISTGGTQVACSLQISQVEGLDLSVLEPHFQQLRAGYTPDEQPVSDVKDTWRHARELVCGFYYHWVVPPPLPWLNARKRWFKFIRESIKDSRTYDSAKQIASACIQWHKDPRTGLNPFVTETTLDGIQSIDTYAAWTAIKDTFEPVTEPVWIDDTVLKYACEWIKNNEGIVWVSHIAVGEKLAEMSGAPYYGEGGLTKSGRNIEDEKTTEPCIASIGANSKGRNLQRYSKNLMVSCPGNGKTWEQAVGRTHRDGQEADLVTIEVVLGCKEVFLGFHNALRDAKYMQDSTGMSQKLLYADITVPSLQDLQFMTGPLWR